MRRYRTGSSIFGICKPSTASNKRFQSKHLCFSSKGSSLAFAPFSLVPTLSVSFQLISLRAQKLSLGYVYCLVSCIQSLLPFVGKRYIGCLFRESFYFSLQENLCTQNDSQEYIPQRRMVHKILRGVLYSSLSLSEADL